MYEIILITLISMFALKATSKPLNSPEMANRIYRLIVDRMMQEPGISGVEITGCDPKTEKKIDLGNDFVYCLRLSGKSDAAVKNLLSIYPVGTKIKGVPVVIDRLVIVPVK